MAVFAFLPLVGVSIVAFPAALYLYVAGEHTTAFLFLGFCVLVALVMENVVKTKMLGAGARMHDLVVFLAVVGGIAVFGLFGLFLGPLIAASFVTLAELYLHAYRTRLASRYQGQRP
jgi:predicted PurR-regulated permease PerM